MDLGGTITNWPIYVSDSGMVTCNGDCNADDADFFCSLQRRITFGDYVNALISHIKEYHPTEDMS